MQEIDLFRNNHLVDPQMHIWGWEIPVYLFLGGVTAGIMILSALGRMRGPAEKRSRWMRWMPFVAPIVLSLGMLALWLDLENRLNVHRFYMAMRPSSPMSWGSWILLAIYPVTLLLGVAGLERDERRWLAGTRMGRALRVGGWLDRLSAWSRQRATTLGWASLVLGIALGGYTGILLGTLAARAAWSSVMLGPLFLVSGLSTGAAVMMLFPLEHGEHELVRRWDMWAIGAEIVLLGLFFLGLMTGGGATGKAAAELFFGGAYTGWFWALVVMGGLVVPLVLESTEQIRRLRPTLAAPALILIGGFALRWILVAAGQA